MSALWLIPEISDEEKQLQKNLAQPMLKTEPFMWCRFVNSCQNIYRNFRQNFVILLVLILLWLLKQI